MKRVMVIGGPGSGKSTLARQLHRLTELPLFHMDQLYWRPGWNACPKDDWRSLLCEIAGREEWIIDGGYDSTFALRMPRADMVLWLDLPRYVAFPRILKRIALNFGRVREDAAEGCPERLDLAFLKWAWTFRKAHAAKYRHALAIYAHRANVQIFASSREANRFADRLSR